jgi:L-fuculose-phosphate aldolase
MARLPRPASAALAGLREELAAACRALAADGLVTGTAGNLSARAGAGVLITPTGAELSRLEGGEIPLVDLDGEVIDGELEPSSEVNLHLGVYRRHGAGAVVHTHAPIATAVSCVLEELPCVHYAMVELGGAVPVAAYHTFGTQALADAVGEALEGHTAVLMANHGTLAYGPDVASAAGRTRLLEWASTIYWRAATLGTARVITADQQREVIAELERRAYGATHRVRG